MMIKYDIDVDSALVQNNLRRIINQVYKLLPMREEGADWQKPLATLMEELAGLNRLLIGQGNAFLQLLSKLEGLFELTAQNDFMLYRRTIFECLGLLNTITNNVVGS